VPKRFGTFISIHLRDTYIFVVSKIGETFELHAAGKTKVITEVRKLEQVNEAFAEVESGKTKARLVFDLR
jgi:propanol-preferring alcohol dehydrogenase